jgi:sodium-dependent dicarboxylate transporter 2/3/5
MAVGMLRESTGMDFTFGEWTAAAIMIVAPLLLIGFLLLLRLFPQDIADVEEGHRYMIRKRLEAGRLTYDEIVVAIVTLLTIFGWVFFGKQLGLATIAILAVVPLFLFRVVSWEAIEEYVNWGVILMYGGAIAIGSALEKTGAAEWLTGRFLGGLADSPVLVVAVVSLISLLLTACISNAAVIAILMPVGLSFAKKMGLDPRIMTLAIALPSGLDFCLPMGTPVNAIAYSSGFLKSREMITSGMLIAAIAWGLFLVSAFFIWPLLGFRI